MRETLLRRALATAALAPLLLLGAASTRTVPTYYSHSEYYSNATKTTQVGGWLSCPPDKGGYTQWGTWTIYETHTDNDFEACPPEW